MDDPFERALSSLRECHHVSIDQITKYFEEKESEVENDRRIWEAERGELLNKIEILKRKIKKWEEAFEKAERRYTRYSEHLEKLVTYDFSKIKGFEDFKFPSLPPELSEDIEEEITQGEDVSQERESVGISPELLPSKRTRVKESEMDEKDDEIFAINKSAMGNLFGEGGSVKGKRERELTATEKKARLMRAQEILFGRLEGEKQNYVFEGPKRRKTDKECANGHSCQDCEKFYKQMRDFGYDAERIKQECSRHRFEHKHRSSPVSSLSSSL